MNYGKRTLKALRVNEGGHVQCPVKGCTHTLLRQKRPFRRADEFCCFDHGIYVSASTFEYRDELDNLLWKDAADRQMLKRLSGVKRESRMARERSEDAVTWNVIRGMEKAAALESWLELVSGFKATGATVAYWSSDPANGHTLGLLEEARNTFGEELNRGTEPDVIVTSATALFFIEAKFTSGNRTQPSDASRAVRYTRGGEGWYDRVMEGDFQSAAVDAHFYELIRMWLLGTWAAHRLGVPFCLVNLVGHGRESSVEKLFGTFIASTNERLFKRATWEGALAHLQAVRPLHAVTPALTEYLREKTAGYGTDGRLRNAFSL